MRRQNEAPAAEIDYVVVGAGSAGCVVAARLAQERGVSVLLLEAGPGDGSPLILMPAAVGYPLRNPCWTWNFATGPEPGLESRRVLHVRGRVVGGSSSINGMVYVRGHPRDFDEWAGVEGLSGWSYAHCLPYFRRLERYEGQASAYRGSDGLVAVTTASADHAMFEAMIEASLQHGLTYNDDYNGFRQEGVYRHQTNIEHGRRVSAASAYLPPVLRVGALRLETEARVTRIRFDGARRAVAVGYEHRGMAKFVYARREIVLCAGTYKSPQLLLLSGVGPANALRTLGIDVVADLPGVGQNLQDHVGVGLGYRSSIKGASPGINVSPLGKLRIGLQWALTGRGLGARNFWETGAFLRSCENAARPDIQHEFLPMCGSLTGRELRIHDGFRYSVSLLRPQSRGSVELASADPDAPPRIVHRYLTEGEDLQTLRNGIRRTVEIVRQRAFDRVRGEPDGPDVATMTDVELESWIRRSAGTFYHPTSSCRMGDDDGSVVDAMGRVHGVTGLRVVDASVMPTIPSGNTNCPTMMVAEKIADAMLGNALAPEPQPYAV